MRTFQFNGVQPPAKKARLMSADEIEDADSNSQSRKRVAPPLDSPTVKKIKMTENDIYENSEDPDSRVLKSLVKRQHPSIARILQTTTIIEHEEGRALDKQAIYTILEQMNSDDIRTAKNAHKIWKQLNRTCRAIVLEQEARVLPLVLLCEASVKLKINLLEYYTDEEILKMPWNVICEYNGKHVEPLLELLKYGVRFPKAPFLNIFYMIVNNYKEQSHEIAMALYQHLCGYADSIDKLYAELYLNKIDEIFAIDLDLNTDSMMVAMMFDSLRIGNPPYDSSNPMTASDVNNSCDPSNQLVNWVPPHRKI